MYPLRGVFRMVDGIDKAVGEEALEFRSDIGLDGQHVRRPEFLPLLQQVKNAGGAIGRPPDICQQMRVSVWRDAPVGRSQKARRWIVDIRHLIEGNISGPIMRGIRS